MSPGIAGDEEEALGRFLFQSDLQALIDRVVTVAKHVDKVQERELVYVGSSRLLVMLGIVCINILIDVVDAIELRSLVADVSDGESGMSRKRKSTGSDRDCRKPVRRPASSLTWCHR